MEATFNFTFFYYSSIVFLVIGIFSAVYKKKLDHVMQSTEEKSSGRAAH